MVPSASRRSACRRGATSRSFVERPGLTLSQALPATVRLDFSSGALRHDDFVASLIILSTDDWGGPVLDSSNTLLGLTFVSGMSLASVKAVALFAFTKSHNLDLRTCTRSL
jgi:hypothetical protein